MFWPGDQVRLSTTGLYLFQEYFWLTCWRGDNSVPNYDATHQIVHLEKQTQCLIILYYDIFFFLISLELLV